MTNPLWVCYADHWLRPLLEHRGAFFKAALPLEKWPSFAKAGPMKTCYRTAALLALRYPERFLYVERLAERVTVGLVAEHAWVWDQESGSILDLTWQSSGRDYLGVAFSSDFLARWVAKHRRADVLFDVAIAHDPEVLAGIVAIPNGASVRFPDDGFKIDKSLSAE